MSIQATCHCGDVVCTVDLEPTEALSCNCSICRRKGQLLAFTTPDRFDLETSREALTVYTFGAHKIRHNFCKRCGCAPFGEGVSPDGKSMVAINLRCVPELDLATIRRREFDGASL